MSTRRFSVIGPVLVAAALLAWLPAAGWAQHHGGGGHGGGPGGGGFHSGGFHSGGFQSSGFRSGGFQSSGFRSGAFQSSGFRSGGRVFSGGPGFVGVHRFPGRLHPRVFVLGVGAGFYGGYAPGGYAYPVSTGPVIVTTGYPPDDTEPSPVEPADYSFPPGGPEGGTGATLTVPSEAPVRVSVELPTPDAQVWFDGNQTQQTGVSRVFVSPPLAPGREYAYDIRARWSEGGRQFDQTRSIRVRAGTRVVVDFTQPAPASPLLNVNQPSPTGPADEDIPPLPPKGPPAQP